MFNTVKPEMQPVLGKLQSMGTRLFSERRKYLNKDVEFANAHFLMTTFEKIDQYTSSSNSTF